MRIIYIKYMNNIMHIADFMEVKMFRKIVYRFMGISLVAILVTLSLSIKYKNDVKALDNRDNIRACWISYLDMEEYIRDLTEEEFRENISYMYQNIKKNNLNTVIVQVRAMSDAIYPSDYFPFSRYISSDRSYPGYDPLEIMVDMAKENGLRFEAWINPYRISLGNDTTNSFMNTAYYEEYSDFIMEYTNQAGELCLSYDPSNTETIRLIVSGVKEILNSYDVDGIHFDDYFYVTGMGDNLTVDEKKEYVNNMIKTIYSTIKSIDNDCEFGISPAGNIDNAREQGADVDRWLREEGYVDYIMPQIYWTDEYVTKSGTTELFSERCRQWNDINILNKPMYLGLALYRVGEKSEIDIGWSTSDENLANQYKKSIGLGFDGYCLFRYKWLDEPTAYNELNNLMLYVDGRFSYPFVKNSYISYTIRQSGIWESAKIDGIRAGTNSSEINSIIITLGDNSPDGEIVYRVMSEDGIWSNWCNGGIECGNTSPMNNIQIMIKGDVSRQFDIIYRCCYTNIGWLPWVNNGEDANSGIINEKMTGIQIKLVKKEAKKQIK